jgi:hypothetical protein
LSFLLILPLLIALISALATDDNNAYYNPLQERDAVPNGYYAPPYYPAPNGGWVSEWSDSYAKAHAVVSQMVSFALALPPKSHLSS